MTFLPTTWWVWGKSNNRALVLFQPKCRWSMDGRFRVITWQDRNESCHSQTLGSSMFICSKRLSWTTSLVWSVSTVIVRLCCRWVGSCCRWMPDCRCLSRCLRCVPAWVLACVPFSSASSPWARDCRCDRGYHRDGWSHLQFWYEAPVPVSSLFIHIVRSIVCLVHRHRHQRTLCWTGDNTKYGLPGLNSGIGPVRGVYKFFKANTLMVIRLLY